MISVRGFDGKASCMFVRTRVTDHVLTAMVFVGEVRRGGLHHQQTWILSEQIVVDGVTG